MSFICHIHNYTEYNEEWNVFSAFNPSKCTHLEQWAADCAAPGEQSWTSCRSRDSNPQPWVTSGFKSNALSIRPTTAHTDYQKLCKYMSALKKSWDLRGSVASWCHHRETQNHSPEHFLSRSWLVEGSSHPHPERWIPDNLQATPENSSLLSSLDFVLRKKKKPSLSFINFALFPLTSHCLARICSEQCLEICITSTSCVCLPLYNVSLIVFLNCKSLWIKASAKWINVNVTCSTNPKSN